MRKILFLLVLTLLCGIMSACGGPEGPYKGPRTATVWLEQSEITPAMILGACSEWMPVNAFCVMTATKAEATIQISINRDAVLLPNRHCQVLPQTIPPTPTKPFTGIVMPVNCAYRDPDGSVDTAWIEGVMTHEIGHSMGIWWHVPETCDGSGHRYPGDSLKTAPDGTKICGPAIMNGGDEDWMDDPRNVHYTNLDGLSFGLRDPLWPTSLRDHPP